VPDPQKETLAQRMLAPAPVKPKCSSHYPTAADGHFRHHRLAPCPKLPSGSRYGCCGHRSYPCPARLNSNAAMRSCCCESHSAADVSTADAAYRSLLRARRERPRRHRTQPRDELPARISTPRNHDKDSSRAAQNGIILLSNGSITTANDTPRPVERSSPPPA
jgi:hypothetical protein